MSSLPNNAVLWETLPLEGSVARVRRPQQGEATGPVAVLLHGWTGDESFMAPFAEIFPPEVLVIAFRAPWPAPSPRGGYSWVASLPEHWPPDVSRYQPATARLAAWLTTPRGQFPQAHWESQHWMGFSQGAATAGTYALERPQGVASVALLAGFLPAGVESWAARRPLEGVPAFIAHGLRDEMVPIQHARHAVDILTQAGARVLFCTDEVAHKVGARCRKALASFYANGFGLTAR